MSVDANARGGRSTLSIFDVRKSEKKRGTHQKYGVHAQQRVLNELEPTHPHLSRWRYAGRRRKPSCRLERVSAPVSLGGRFASISRRFPLRIPMDAPRDPTAGRRRGFAHSLATFARRTDARLGRRREGGALRFRRARRRDPNALRFERESLARASAR